MPYIYIILYYILLYYIMLYYVILYYNILCYIIYTHMCARFTRVHMYMYIYIYSNSTQLNLHQNISNPPKRLCFTAGSARQAPALHLLRRAQRVAAADGGAQCGRRGRRARGNSGGNSQKNGSFSGKNGFFMGINGHHWAKGVDFDGVRWWLLLNIAMMIVDLFRLGSRASALEMAEMNTSAA